MFPLLRTRAARVLDVAIEFATLGEYRLTDDAIARVAAAPRRGHRLVEPAERRWEGAPVRPAARVVVPASFAGRLRPALEMAPPPVASTRVRLAPLDAGATVQELALGSAGPVATPLVRTRGGATPPPQQSCDGPRR